jgi:hypothetical protein
MTIDTTIALRGSSAIAYAEITGATLLLAEARFGSGPADGRFRPRRTVTAEEARREIRRGAISAEELSTHAQIGERPYRAAGPIEIDWPGLHAAVLLVDELRAPYRLGYDGNVDAWGGTYFPPTYEREGLAGVVRLLGGAQAVRHDAWEAIHSASKRPDGAARARCALRTSFALHPLFEIFHAIGIYIYNPGAEICGVTDTVAVTGMRWLAGEPYEGQPLTRREALEFAFGAEKRS